MGITERLMRQAILRKLEMTQDYNKLSQLHQNYWINKGSDFFSNNEKSFENEFLTNCTFISDILEKELLNSSVNFQTFLEIGPDNGYV